MVRRFNQCRFLFSDVLNYLHSGKNDFSIHANLDVQPASKQQVTIAINKMVKKLEKDVLELFLDFKNEFEQVTESPTKKQKCTTFFDELNKTLSQAVETPKESQPAVPSLTSAIKQEMQVFETSGQRGANLSFAYQSLLSIPGTSVESERAF